MKVGCHVFSCRSLLLSTTVLNDKESAAYEAIQELLMVGIAAAGGRDGLLYYCNY